MEKVSQAGTRIEINFQLVVVYLEEQQRSEAHIYRNFPLLVHGSAARSRKILQKLASGVSIAQNERTAPPKRDLEEFPRAEKAWALLYLKTQNIAILATKARCLTCFRGNSNLSCHDFSPPQIHLFEISKNRYLIASVFGDLALIISVAALVHVIIMITVLLS